MTHARFEITTVWDVAFVAERAYKLDIENSHGG